MAAPPQPLSRPVLRWLQTLGLSPRCPRRDLASGYMVAQIFAHYHEDLRLVAFDEGSALERRMGNWDLLKKFMGTHGLSLPEDVVEGTLHSKPGAAEVLLETLYTLLTNKSVPDRSRDFTDFSYQLSLPPHARATTTTAIKANLKGGEEIAVPDLHEQQRRLGLIIDLTTTIKASEREGNPERYNITLRGPTGHVLSGLGSTTALNETERSSSLSPSSPPPLGTLRVAQSPRPLLSSP